MKSILEKLFIFLLFGTLVLMFLHIFPSRKSELTDLEEDWLKKQSDRRSTLNFTCLNKTSASLEWKLQDMVARQLFVDENHKLIYCEVPKVGCSNWKKIILLLTLNMNRDASEVDQQTIHTTKLLKRLSSYPSEQQIELLNNYTKVMFTRHPLERLVSAYRDKLLHSEPYYSITVANQIKALLRRDQNSSEKVTFPEFVDFIVTRNHKYLDTHWKPMFELCDPCNVHYDILGKFETLIQDVNHVLRRIRAPEGLLYPYRKKMTDNTITLNYLRKLSWDQMQKLTELYQADFSSFGYSLTFKQDIFL
ncbi:carbohydrate sulfotransferase 8-like [Elgaria multicarinata webbii]|uniref:carbohydrate sulfotransferase 8-like n=1 Tax=Elgaria multicarinata webbii TaxID=159646 RepID=UPI002FCCF5F7